MARALCVADRKLDGNKRQGGSSKKKKNKKKISVTYLKIQKLLSHLPAGPEELKAGAREDICEPTLLAT